MDTMRLTWHRASIVSASMCYVQLNPEGSCRKLSDLKSSGTFYVQPNPGGSGQTRNRIREALAGRGIEIGSERHLPDAESNPRGSRRTRNRIQEALEDGVAIAT